MHDPKPEKPPLRPEAIRLVLPPYLEQELARLRPDEAGRYAWDRWRERALEAGLDDKLAWLGRNLMREAVQHAWRSDLQAECGWEDEGQAMLELALREPKRAARRWQRLMDTDGLIGRWDKKTNTFKLFKKYRGW